ncbi:MAG: hypothetical protein AAF560_22260, partial [Acidobacteriota bacterium]
MKRPDMKRSRSLPLLLLILSFTSIACTTVDYRSPTFAHQSQDHRTVAVLPFEMIFAGKAPRGMTARQIQAIEEQESIAFQTSLYLRLLNRIDRGYLDIDVQQVEETNRILAAHRIDIRDSWYMSPQELAQVLGVDAVVRTRVEKTRYLSDGASFGIDLGTHILAEILHDDDDHHHHDVVHHGMVKTHDIFADGALLSG